MARRMKNPAKCWALVESENVRVTLVATKETQPLAMSRLENIHDWVSVRLIYAWGCDSSDKISLHKHAFEA